MSDAKQPPKVTDAPERPKHGPQVRGHGPMGGMGVQEKAINFGPSLRRLLGTLRPERPRIIAVMVLTSIAVVANVVQPKILGSMTDLLFTGLLGAMFIIEGLGAKRAADWAARFQEVLGLADNQVNFMRYHHEADGEHTGNMNAILTSGIITDEDADEIVRCAQVVARLYALQLAELDS